MTDVSTGAQIVCKGLKCLNGFMRLPHHPFQTGTVRIDVFEDGDEDKLIIVRFVHLDRLWAKEYTSIVY